MNYRFLKISKYYPQYIKYFHENNNVAEMTYDQMLDAYMNDHYIYGNAYSKYLKRIGNETKEIIYNDSQMLKKWAWANKDMQLSSDEAIIEEMIRQYKPDVIFWDGADYSFVEHIRQIMPGIRIHYSQIGVAINESVDSLPFDFVVSCLKSHVDMMIEHGMKAEFIKHGFDHEILEELETSESKNGFVFSGSIAKGVSAHQERAEHIGYLMKNTDITVYSAFRNPGRSDTVKHLIKKAAGKTLYPVSKLLSNSSALNKRLQLWSREPKLFSLPYNDNNRVLSPIFGMNMYNMLASAEIVLNIHIGIAGKHAANLRMYETTGVGTCMLTDYKSDISEYFEPDNEILTFKSPEEAEEKYRFLKDHPEEIARIALNGQKRTLKCHTMKQRIEQLNDIIVRYLQ